MVLIALLTYDSHDFLALDEDIGTVMQLYDKAEKRLTNFINKAGTLIASHSSELLKSSVIDLVF